MTAAAEPVVPRPAATVVLMRPQSGALEVLLTHRPASMAFAPDMHVFPGGRVDPADADERLVARSVITPEDAAAALGGDLSPTDAIAACIAAIRETFEETGVLLADAGRDHRGPVGGASARALDMGRAELLHVPGAFAPMVEALDLRLRTDLLVPLARWVTPPGLPRRFDARFFAAELPDGAAVSLIGEEVAAHAWHTPRAALDELAAGRLGMWLPTSSTLQRLEHAWSFADVATRLAPGPLGTIAVDEIAEGITRIELPAGGGVAGQPVCAYLVGGPEVVLVDPGDPTGAALDRALEIVAGRGGRIVAVALTHVDPDHSAGAEAIRETLDVPVFVGPGGGHDLPFRTETVDDGAVIDAGASRMTVIATPGPRPDHIAFLVDGPGDGPGDDRRVVLTGDLDGIRGARSLPGPGDDVAWAASLARVRAAAPDARWLGGHPAQVRPDPPAGPMPGSAGS